ncbi:male-specific histamine-binding salivary protein-like [Ornithodoros turicata]|uniref:male-specific histamine-binding salivary protein-like n=1 Tax=Ornithodoros turicata TaxID=34597 RepID=UPI003139F3DB
MCDEPCRLSALRTAYYTRSFYSRSFLAWTAQTSIVLISCCLCAALCQSSTTNVDSVLAASQASEMKLILFVLFATCNAVEYWERFFERRPELSKYQNATRSMAVTSKRFLVYRTYELDQAFGAAFPCVSIQQTNQTEDNTNASTVMRFYNTTSKNWVKYTVPAKALTSTNYTVPNVIRAGFENIKTADSPIMFSDYETCDVVRAPHTGNASDCELWVAQENVTNYPSCCDFIYKLLCAPQKFQIYYENCTEDSVPTL